MQTQKLGLMPTLIALLAVFALAILVGVIVLMMMLRTGIKHSPEQSRLEERHASVRLVASGGPGSELAPVSREFSPAGWEYGREA
jgi:hypothetical protein